MSVIALAALSLFTTPAPLPERLVTLGGSVSETVAALGAKDLIVGTDTSTLYPPELKALPMVGYYRAASAEGVLSLRPTRVIAIDGAGPAVVLKQIAAAGVEVLMADGEKSVEGARARITAIARLLDREGQGERLLKAMDRELDRAARIVSRSSKRPRALFVLSHSKGAVLVAGQNTGPHRLIERAGGVNAFDGYEGYKPLSAEGIIAARPDVILIGHLSLETIGGKSTLLGQPGFSATRAGKEGRVIVLDELLLLGFGPRTGQVVRLVAEAFHPQTIER